MHRAQHRQQGRIDTKAPRALGLRGRLATGKIDRVVHGQRARREIKIVPRQSGELGGAESGVRGHHDGAAITQRDGLAARQREHVRGMEVRSRLHRASIRTVEILQALVQPVPSDYLATNILYELLSPHPPRFERLLPFLVQWAKSLPVE